MASLRRRDDTGMLFFDLRWQGKRYRAQTDVADSPEGRKQLTPKLRQVNAAIKSGSFSLRTYFPELEQRTAAPLATEQKHTPLQVVPPPAVPSHSTTFGVFAEQWFTEFKVGWRRTYVVTVRGILDLHLLPRFGPLDVSAVSRTGILELRSHLAGTRGRRPGTKLSPARINTIMLILRQILQEAADRFNFQMPMQRLKPLKVPKSNVMPFTLEQTHLLISSIRKDYRNYLKTRFYTGMRSGELHGLKWKYIDFERRLILVRETLVGGEEEYTKTDFSQRDIPMSNVVHDALREQHRATGQMTYVFCNRAGAPVDTDNFTKRVWYPLLRHLGLELRRPYQTRHTAAALWLAAGEAPEWIAKVLGHASTEMLFRVYSRYVPNMTRRDGSALDRLLATRFAGESAAPGAANDAEHPGQPPPARLRRAA